MIVVARVKDTDEGFHGAIDTFCSFGPLAPKVELGQIFTGLPKKKYSTTNSSLKLKYLVHTLNIYLKYKFSISSAESSDYGLSPGKGTWTCNNKA